MHELLGEIDNPAVVHRHVVQPRDQHETLIDLAGTFSELVLSVTFYLINIMGILVIICYYEKILWFSTTVFQLDPNDLSIFSLIDSDF